MNGRPPLSHMLGWRHSPLLPVRAMVGTLRAMTPCAEQVTSLGWTLSLGIRAGSVWQLRSHLRFLLSGFNARVELRQLDPITTGADPVHAAYLGRAAALKG